MSADLSARRWTVRSRSSYKAVLFVAMAASKMILCVDDEAVGLRVRKLLLETQGHKVLTARKRKRRPKSLLFSSD